MLIMAGTQRDGIYQEHVTQTQENAIYMAMMGEMLNATAVGATKAGLDVLCAMKGKELQVLKRGLVGRYASAERMQKGAK